MSSGTALLLWDYTILLRTPPCLERLTGRKKARCLPRVRACLPSYICESVSIWQDGVAGGGKSQWLKVTRSVLAASGLWLGGHLRRQRGNEEDLNLMRLQ